MAKAATATPAAQKTTKSKPKKKAASSSSSSSSSSDDEPITAAPPAKQLATPKSTAKPVPTNKFPKRKDESSSSSDSSDDEVAVAPVKQANSKPAPAQATPAVISPVKVAAATPKPAAKPVPATKGAKKQKQSSSSSSDSSDGEDVKVAAVKQTPKPALSMSPENIINNNTVPERTNSNTPCPHCGKKLNINIFPKRMDESSPSPDSFEVDAVFDNGAAVAPVKQASYTRVSVDPSRTYRTPESRESWGPNVKGKKFRKEKGKKKRCPNSGVRIDGAVKSFRFDA